MPGSNWLYCSTAWLYHLKFGAIGPYVGTAWPKKTLFAIPTRSIPCESAWRTRMSLKPSVVRPQLGLMNELAIAGHSWTTRLLSPLRRPTSWPAGFLIAWTVPLSISFARPDAWVIGTQRTSFT